MKGFGIWKTNKKPEAAATTDSASTPAQGTPMQPAQRRSLFSAVTTAFNAGAKAQPVKTQGIATSKGFVAQRQLTTTTLAEDQPLE